MKWARSKFTGTSITQFNPIGIPLKSTIPRRHATLSIHESCSRAPRHPQRTRQRILNSISTASMASPAILNKIPIATPTNAPKTGKYHTQPCRSIKSMRVPNHLCRSSASFEPLFSIHSAVLSLAACSRSIRRWRNVDASGLRLCLAVLRASLLLARFERWEVSVISFGEVRGKWWWMAMVIWMI